MGIKCFLIRASQEELAEKALHPKKSDKDCVLKWALGSDIQTLDPSKVVVASKNETSSSNKKQKTEEVEAATRNEDNQVERNACRLDMDKSWTGIHWLCLARHKAIHQNDTDAYEEHAIRPEKASPAVITAFLLEKNKWYEVTVSYGKGETTRYGGNIINMKPRTLDIKALKASFAKNRENMQTRLRLPPLAEASHTLLSKLNKNYKALLIGSDLTVQARYEKRPCVGKTLTTPGDNEDPTLVVDVATAKDAGVTARLQEQFGLAPDQLGSNAKARIVTLFRSFFLNAVQPKSPLDETCAFHLAYLLYGGEPTCFLVHDTGRVLTPHQVQQWSQELQALQHGSDDLATALKDVFDPSKMQPGNSDDIILEWKEEDWDYLATHIQALQYFLECAVADGHGILVYVA